MGKDQANIFKLEGAEFKKYKDEPFWDSFKSTKEFADALKRDIETKETPHVLLLEADFGMGKTFFSTRFTQYLRNEKIDAIYFSAWENDYLPEPFVSFSKEIVNYINKKYKANKFKEIISNVFTSIENVVASISISIPFASISTKELIESFKDKTDPIANFKKNLKKFIKQIGIQRVVIIVDELDRCRPDYAMKVLECIKHFFNIEGLFIIIPTNRKSLCASVKSLYNIEDNLDNNKQCERYHEKFFNDERKIKPPTLEDYRLIVEKHLNEKTLKQAILKKLITTEENLFNSINILIEACSNYCIKVKPTLRQTENYLKELCRMCCNFYEPVRAEWLAAVLLKRNENDILNTSLYLLDKDNCLSLKNPQESNGKYKFFKLDSFYQKVITINAQRMYYPWLNRTLTELKKRPTSNLKNLEELVLLLDKKAELLKELEEFGLNGTVLEVQIKEVKTAYEAEKNRILNYMNRYGSDSQDDERKLKYIEIVKNPEKLYENYQDGKT